LQILSASLTSFAADDERPARETCDRLRVPFKATTPAQAGVVIRGQGQSIEQSYELADEVSQHYSVRTYSTSGRMSLPDCVHHGCGAAGRPTGPGAPISAP
jgi:hypothetical protein